MAEVLAYKHTNKCKQDSKRCSKIFSSIPREAVMLKYSSQDTHPQKISWTCRPLLRPDALHAYFVSQCHSFMAPGCLLCHLFHLTFSLSLCLLPGTNTDHGRHVTQLLFCPTLSPSSLSTHLCLAWMKSLSFWNSVKPQMENYFTSLFQQDCAAGLLTPALRREGRGRAEGKEEGGRTTAPNWHEAERQWKTPMASLPYEFMSALLPLIGHSSIVLRRLSQSASPNQTAALGSGVRMSFYGCPYVQHHVLLLTTSASMQNSLNLHFGLVLE